MSAFNFDQQAWIEAAPDYQAPLDAGEALDPADQWEAGEDPGDPERVGGRGARAYSLAELSTTTFPVRPALLTRGGVPVLRAGNLAELVGERGRGKSWVLLTLAILAASGGSALGFEATEPRRVLFVDGEMPGDTIRERALRLCDMLGVDPRDTGDRLRFVAADWQRDYLPRLDTPEGQTLIAREVEGADLIMLDNRSCLLDPEGERDGSAWQPAQEWLLSLRRRGKAVLMAHHANRQGAARGHSKAEDPLDIVWQLSLPDGYRQDEGCRFRFEWKKSRGVHGEACAEFVAALTDDGWRVEGAEGAGAVARERQAVEAVRAARNVGEPITTASALAKAVGGRKTDTLNLIAGLLDRKQLLKRDDGFAVP